jgi:hypothetical protein
VDPKEGDGDDQMRVVENDHDGRSPGTEEARVWKQIEPEVLLKPKYGVEGEDFENVWVGDGPSESPKENP